MSEYFSEKKSVEAVNSRMGDEINPRFKEVMASLIGHLHAFVKDVELSQEEWNIAIDFLTKTGQLCSEERQEFILLSDTLGVSMLVDAINNRRPEKATENTVFGPFHVAGSPIRNMGDNISLDNKGEACLFYGRVLDIDGHPVEGACIDVWSDNADGFYDVQQPQDQPKWNNRGRFITQAYGRYEFHGIKPVSYPILDDGTVGQMLNALGRHPFRPAHMHFLIAAAGFETVVTHTFVDGDQYLDNDTVFGVKESLITEFKKSDSDDLWKCLYDFVLVPK